MDHLYLLLWLYVIFQHVIYADVIMTKSRNHRNLEGNFTQPSKKESVNINSTISNNYNNTNNNRSKVAAVQKNVTHRVNALALRMDALISGCQEKEENLLIAPINIIKTLATVMLGTSGATEQELAYALGFAFGQPINNVIPEFHKAMGRLLRKMIIDESTGLTLDIASGIFVDANQSIKASFEKNAKDIYLSQMYHVNFSKDGFGAAQFINNWVSNYTRGKINEVVASPTNANTKVIIAGVMYFNGNWANPFLSQLTRWQPFYLTSGGKHNSSKKVLVELMVNQGPVKYYENKNLGFKAIGIRYNQSDLYMYVVLPKLNLSLKNLICSLPAQEIDNMVTESKMTDVFYVIPKMKLSFKTNLKESLQKMNVNTLFDPLRANFSNLSPTGGMYASDILHKVEMDVNELGTTAAAATTSSVNRGGYINFRVDRPFFLFIYNADIGIMTFWASVQKPHPYKLDTTHDSQIYAD